MLPKWDNSDEYTSFTSLGFENDIKVVKAGIEKLKVLTLDHANALENSDQVASNSLIVLLQEVIIKRTEIYTILSNLASYVNCEQALDAQNQEAHRIDSQLEDLKSDFEIAFSSWELFLLRTSNENFLKIMSSDKMKDYVFYYSHERKMSPTLLSSTEENIITKLKSAGHLAWGNLYNAISGTAKVNILKDGAVEKVSIAVATGLTKMNDENVRREAWEGLQKVWTEHKQSVAQILNSLAGWRLDMNQLRSINVKQDFLDLPLHENRITEKTLNAMMTAINEFKPQIQLGAKTMAKHLGKEKLSPWDLLAPAPVKSKDLSFKDSFAKVKNSFSSLDQRMGDFAQMMLDKNWIDASIRPNKSNGAFCTGFAKSRNPRIFLTFTGTTHDTSTMAHELGHAYHSWVMRDMNKVASSYTMSLAETASIFAENVLFDYEIENAKSKNDLLEVYWSMTEQAVGLLLNISTRFDFEKSFYEKRKTGYVSPDELSELMSESFKNWYGDSLSEPDTMYWASKLHFSIAELSFYNFPYTFGYLFSLSLFARKDEWGKDFSSKYINILRDTGMMTAEDLIKKHLDEDITKVDFWRKSLNFVSEKIQKFSELEV